MFQMHHISVRLNSVIAFIVSCALAFIVLNGRAFARLDAVTLFMLHGSDLGDQNLVVSKHGEKLIKMAPIGSVSVIGIATRPDN
jgi:hypothetical protein